MLEARDCSPVVQVTILVDAPGSSARFVSDHIVPKVAASQAYQHIPFRHADLHLEVELAARAPARASRRYSNHCAAAIDMSRGRPSIKKRGDTIGDSNSVKFYK
jgi:hypothetical protein